jgi:PAS domain S-box-containing protein
LSLKYLFAIAFLAADAMLLAGFYGLIPLQNLTVLAVSACLALIASAAAWFVDILDRRLLELRGNLSTLADKAEILPRGERGDDLLALSAAIDALRRQQSELRARAEQNRVLAEHGPDAMFVFDTDAFRLVDVNENFISLSGYPRDRLIGMTPMDFSPPRQAGAIATEAYARQLVERVMKGDKLVTTWVLRTRGGDDVPCELRAVKLMTEGRNLLCGSLMDVSGRVQAQEELAYRMRFEALITRLSTGMISLTPERVDAEINRALAEVGNFANVDRCYVFLFDETRTHVTNTHEWCAPGVEPEIARLQNLPAREYPWCMPKLLQGEVVHVPRVRELPPEARAERVEWEQEFIQSLLMVPVQAAGQVVGYAGFDSVKAEKTWSGDAIGLLRIFGEMVFSAMTRKNAEKALRQKTEDLGRANEQLERSNIELQQYAYVASHDLQEPLRNIASFTGLLARRYKGQLDAAADGYITYIIESTERLSRMIKDMLEYSRLDSQSRPFQACHLGRVFNTAVANLGASLQEAGAQVSHDELPIVRGDPSQLTQVLQNLISNAIKFRGDAPPQVRIESRFDNGGWRVSVRDNGIGIRPEEARQLFQPFKRLHSHDRYPGSGIGLAVCKRIVERHQGRIWVEPNDGAGCTFHFTLPAAAAEAA